MTDPVTEPEARSAYLAMQGRRSVERLRGQFIAASRTIPSIRTVKGWCANHEWLRLAREHDESIAAAASAELAKDSARKVVTRAGQFDQLATDSLKKALEGLEHIDTSALKATDIRALAEISERAAKMFELLEGRATERTDDMTREKMDGLIADMTGEIEERLAGVPVIH